MMTSYKVDRICHMFFTVLTDHFDHGLNCLTLFSDRAGVVAMAASSRHVQCCHFLGPRLDDYNNYLVATPGPCLIVIVRLALQRQ